MEGSSSPESLLLEKRQYLRRELAVCSDASARFSIEQEFKRIDLYLQEFTGEQQLPWRVPNDNPFFTGRKAILEDLHQALQGDGRGQALSGLGGVGKTQIAIEYCHRYRDHYDAIFWIRSETEEEARSDFGNIASLLGLPQASALDQDVAMDAVRSWLETHHGWLIVFDNADEPDLIKPFLPTGNRGKMLLTSRIKSFASLGIGEPIKVPVLHLKEASNLLLKRTGRRNTDKAEQKAATRLAENLGGLPLALEQAASYISACEMRFQNYLEKPMMQMLTKCPPQTGDYRRTVETTWLISLDAVRKCGRQISGSLSPVGPNLPVDLMTACAFLAPDAIPLKIFANADGTVVYELSPEGDQLDDVLKLLLRYSLMDRDTKDRTTIRVHRMVQEAMRSHFGDKRKEWVEKVVAMLSRAFPSPDNHEDWPLCEQLMPHIQAVDRFAAGAKSVRLARLLNRAGIYAFYRANFSTAESLFVKAKEIFEDRLGSEDREIAELLINLATLYNYRREYRDPDLAIDTRQLYHRAMEILEKAVDKDDPLMARTFNDLARHYAEDGEPLYQRALEIRRAAPDRLDIAQTLNDLANLWANQGRFEEAEEYYQEARVICEEELGTEHPAFATTLRNLAELYCDQMRLDEARPLYEQAVAIFEGVLGAEHPYTRDARRLLGGLQEHEMPKARAFVLGDNYTCAAATTTPVHQPRESGGSGG